MARWQIVFTAADLFVISFTFRGIIATRYWDLHRLFLSVMCPPYKNWSNYWLTCPQQVKSVNGSIAILMSKNLSLWCFRKAAFVGHKHIFSPRLTQYDKLPFLELKYWLAIDCIWSNCCFSDFPSQTAELVNGIDHASRSGLRHLKQLLSNEV